MHQTSQASKHAHINDDEDNDNNTNTTNKQASNQANRQKTKHTEATMRATATGAKPFNDKIDASMMFLVNGQAAKCPETSQHKGPAFLHTFLSCPLDVFLQWNTTPASSLQMLIQPAAQFCESCVPKRPPFPPATASGVSRCHPQGFSWERSHDS